MGGQAQQQPVFYDADMGQYYTQEFQSPSYGMYNNPMFNGMGYMQQSPMSALSAMLGKGGERTYLNNFGQSSPAMQPQAPYQYADVSLASLFPMLQGQSQGGALNGLLNGTPSAVGMAQQDAQARAAAPASSGAGRFM
jgi:hypothetical protein